MSDKIDDAMELFYGDCWRRKKLGENPDEIQSEKIKSQMVEIETKEKELQSAKAENARLVEACAPFVIFEKAIHAERNDSERLARALSSSNALDYWQGEVRKARDKAKLGIASYLEQFENSVNCDEMAQLIRDDVARQSNPQSKGEKTGG